MIFLFRTKTCQAVAIPVSTKSSCPMHSSIKSREKIPSYSQTKPSQDSRSVNNDLEEKTNESDICNLKELSQQVALYAVPEKLKSKVIAINKSSKFN